MPMHRLVHFDKGGWQHNVLSSPRFRLDAQRQRCDTAATGLVILNKPTLHRRADVKEFTALTDRPPPWP